ncbi:Sh3 domain YSC-like 1, partial [Caulochytrium protostelioides]
MVGNPIPSDLASECRKCSKIINQFIKPDKGMGPDQMIPPNIIGNAKGIAIMSVLKAGFLFSARAGSGLVVARLDDGSWSAPSAIGTGGIGAGGQIGAELTDFVFILNTKDAVKAFSHGGNLTFGGNVSVAVGPLGRNAEASGSVGNLAAIFSYSKTRGLFAGVSLEGTVLLERKDANAAFYHRKISAKELLTGVVPPPPVAEELYRALNRRV